MNHHSLPDSPERAGHIILVVHARGYRDRAFAQAAHRLGIRVTAAVDTDPRLPQPSTSALGISLARPEAAAEAIAIYAQTHPVDAVLAVDDAGTLVAALAAQALGLSHNASVAARAARDKILMRRLMAAAGVPCPWFRAYSTADDPASVAVEIPFPCVVKPPSLNGSRGVIRADTPAELAEAVARLTKLLDHEYPDVGPHPYLIESFIPGREVALEGLLDEGTLHVLALFDKPDPLDGPYFEETIYITPSRLPAAAQTTIAQCVEEAAAALGLQQGPIHAELRVNDEGPWMLEVAGRSIGGLCSRTLRFGVDQSLEELILRQACSLPLATVRSGRASGVMMIPIPAAGVLQRVTGVEAAKAVAGIEDVEITARVHDSITPLPEGESYLGFIFARGSDPVLVEDALRRAHAELEFTILPEFELEAMHQR